MSIPSQTHKCHAHLGNIGGVRTAPLYIALNYTSYHDQKFTVLYPATCPVFSSLYGNRFVLLAQYCAGDKIEKNEMGSVCGAYG